MLKKGNREGMEAGMKGGEENLNQHDKMNHQRQRRTQGSKREETTKDMPDSKTK